MNHIGVTGHQNLSFADQQFVKIHIEQFLSRYDSLVGISNLAAGTDQLFAQIVLAFGGSLEAIIPSQSYEQTFITHEYLTNYNELLSRATKVTVLPYNAPGEDAYFSAGQEVVRQCDVLIAVWNGKPARGLGGTADVVSFALRQRVPIYVIAAEPLIERNI